MLAVPIARPTAFAPPARVSRRRLHPIQIAPLLVTFAVVFACSCQGARSQPPTDGGPAPRWQVRDVDSGAQIVRHQRKSASAEGPAADALKIRAGYGTQAFAYLQIPPARVISELRVSVPIRADRVGVQAMVRVVLPRTTDPKADGPITLLLQGSSCQTTTVWTTLNVQNIPQQLQRRVAVLQLSFDETIDAREAYIDMILVNVYGGAGVTNVALGDPVIEGAAAIPEHGLDGSAIYSVAYRSRKDVRSSAARAEGDILHVRKRPLFVRMIDDNREPWSMLKSLGVNTVRLSAPVTFEQLATAGELGLWIVSPPPRTHLSNNLSRHFDRVIAWDMGSALTEADIPATRDLARRVRDADQPHPLPIACGPMCELGAYGRFADILIHRRAIPSRALQSGDDYGRWLQRRIESARPATVHWAAIETQPAPATITQALALGSNSTPRLDAAAIRSQAFVVAATGGRGIYFRSRSRLDAPNPEAKHRQLAIQRTNLELQLIEPWLATGRRSPDTITAPPHYSASALQTDHSTLFFLTRDELEEPSTEAPAEPTTSRSIKTRPLRLVIPDASETAGVYRIGPSGLVPVSHRRVAGGMEVTASNSVNALLPQVVLLLVTRDESIVRAVADRINSHCSAITDAIGQQLEIELDSQCRRPTNDSAARRSQEAFKATAAQGDLAAAHEMGAALLDELQHARICDWRAAAQTLVSPTACALATHTNTRDALRSFLRAIPRSRQNYNLLGAGGCDQWNTMSRAGWQTSVDQQRANAQTTITTDRPHAGTGCLQMTAAWSDTNTNRITDDRAIVRTDTPPVAVGAGQVVRIVGWVKLERPLNASGQLVIFDSLTGPALGLRVTHTVDADWQSFTIYRAAAEESAELTLSFALTGPGTAQIDEISVTPVLTTRALQIP